MGGRAGPIMVTWVAQPEIDEASKIAAAECKRCFIAVVISKREAGARAKARRPMCISTSPVAYLRGLVNTNAVLCRQLKPGSAILTHSAPPGWATASCLHA